MCLAPRVCSASWVHICARPRDHSAALEAVRDEVARHPAQSLDDMLVKVDASRWVLPEHGAVFDTTVRRQIVGFRRHLVALAGRGSRQPCQTPSAVSVSSSARSDAHRRYWMFTGHPQTCAPLKQTAAPAWPSVIQIRAVTPERAAKAGVTSLGADQTVSAERSIGIDPGLPGLELHQADADDDERGAKRELQRHLFLEQPRGQQRHQHEDQRHGGVGDR